jgi:glycosyltransferase involved in cell wall biosynthesis
MTRVCIDVQSAVTQGAGVGRYTRELVRHLGRASGGNADVSLVYFDFKGGGTPFEAPAARWHRVGWCPGRVAQWAWKSAHWPPYDWFAPGADVYHFPNFLIPPLRRGRSVVTIHDMSFMRFPEFAEARNLRYLRAEIARTAARADAVITDSRFSAGEIAEFLAVHPERVFPIHLGIDKRFEPAEADSVRRVRAGLGLERPYLLTVGTVEPRKNLPFLVETFERMDWFDGELVIAGMPGWKCDPIFERIRVSTRKDAVRYVRYVEDRDLPALYTGASAFVVASHYEGFGFPPLEAMACGTPVVSSAGGSLAEVLADGAVVMNDMDADAWSAELRAVLEDASAREALTARGRAVAGRYRWEETARQTWDVYRGVAE